MSHGQRSSRAKRLLAARRRRPRLARLAKVAGSRAKLIVTSGVIPAALYDAEVHGVSDAEYNSPHSKSWSACGNCMFFLILGFLWYGMGIPVVGLIALAAVLCKLLNC